MLPVPVDIFSEEGMSLDLFSSVVAETPRRITLQQTSHYTTRLGTHIRREYQGVGENALVHRVDLDFSSRS